RLRFETAGRPPRAPGPAGDEAFVQALVQMVGVAFARQRRSAAMAAIAAGDHPDRVVRLARAFRELLDSDEVALRANGASGFALAASWGGMPAAEAIPSLEPLLVDPDHAVRLAAAIALTRLDDLHAAHHLLLLAQHTLSGVPPVF